MRVVNNMGIEVNRGEQGNLAVKIKPHFPPGLFKGKFLSILFQIKSLLVNSNNIHIILRELAFQKIFKAKE